MTPLKNKRIEALKREALDERKVSFKVESEISEVREEEENEDAGDNDLNLSGKGGRDYYQGLNSNGSRLGPPGRPSQFEEVRSGALSQYQDDSSSDEYDDEYGEEDEGVDSDESDENLILLNEIKHTMSRMFRKIERIDR